MLSVLLSATAAASAGTIGFVGLVAPHEARALVGTAEALGRTVIAPAQLGQA